LVDDGDVEGAERMLTESMAVCGQDLRLREFLEEVQVAKPRGRLAVAERLAEQQQTPQAMELVQQLRTELARAELAFFTVRTERHPANMELKYQLGVRLRRLGNSAEAIKVFAQSLESEPVRALSLLEMGECHQRLKQYAKASEAYQQAIVAAQLPGQLEVKKHGLYRAANLAVGLRDFSLAERLYGELLGLDPAFKDARDRLDKIPQIRDSG
jgi:tetratricopeptide (TPR) repeat protein